MTAAPIAAIHEIPLLIDAEADEASYCQVGRALLELAARIGRREAALASVEVFRTALTELPEEPSFQNGLGAALVELSRLEPNTAALNELTEACQQFTEALAIVTTRKAPTAVRVRYEINLAMASLMLGERLGDTERIEAAAEKLQSTLNEPAWGAADSPRALELLGNALLTLNKPAKARRAYQAAKDQWRPIRADKDRRKWLAERGRLLTNLGTTYAEQGDYAAARRVYGEALALQPADYVPLAWGRTQYNLGRALLQDTLPGGSSPQNADLIRGAIRAFKAARDTYEHIQASRDWIVITVGLGNALLSYGTYLCLPGPETDWAAGIENIEHAIALSKGVFLDLTPPDLTVSFANFQVAFELLGRLSDSSQMQAKLRDHLVEVTSLRIGYFRCYLKDKETDQYNFLIEYLAKYLPDSSTFAEMGRDANLVVADIFDILAASGLPKAAWPDILRDAIDRISPPGPLPLAATEVTRPPSAAEKKSVPPLPAAAPEFYADRTVRERLGRKENIIEFLERVYNPWILADVAALSRPMLRRFDSRAEMALRHWLRANDHKLPDRLAIPTKSEAIDQMVETGSVPEPMLPRVGQALERRLQRARKQAKEPR